MATILTAQRQREPFDRQPRRREVWLTKMHLGCTICTEMYGSGAWTTGTRATTELRRMGVNGRAGATRVAGCCAAARGTTLPATAARRVATGLPRASAATPSGFGL